MSKNVIKQTEQRDALLTADNVCFTVRQNNILNNVSMHINAGEIVTIVGPNGAGKSTLIKTLLRLQKPTSGKITHCKDLILGYVPQSINRDETFPMTVKEFLRLSKRFAKFSNKFDVLNQLGIEHLAKQFLYQLSGGETRKVLLARALLNHPNLLVLDEPTAGVDVKGQSAFYHSLDDLRKQYGFSILMVSHDLHFVMAKTDRVICLNKHVCCAGTPKSIETDPVFIAQFGQILQDESLAVFNHKHDHTHS